MKHILPILTGAIALASCVTAIPTPSHAQLPEMARIRSACAAMGLRPGEAPFVYCVMSLSDSAPPQPYAMNGGPRVSDAVPYRPAGYNAADACSAIGLDPTTARYSYCVGNLRATIDQANNIGAR